MNKKVFIVMSVSTLVLLGALNVGLGYDKKSDGANLSLVEIEAQAGLLSEIGDAIVNAVQGQGLTKDEEELPRKCPTKSTEKAGISASAIVNGVVVKAEIGKSSSQENPSDREEITCKVGSKNCTPVKC